MEREPSYRYSAYRQIQWNTGNWSARLGKARDEQQGAIDGFEKLDGALSLEALGWVSRGASLENLRSAQSAAISVLMACYAVLLVAGGVFYRSAVNRIAGLGLIGVVVAKLYLYDVWLLVRIYRIAAFGALGALLLLVSYVYSRNRVAIESWWNDRNARP